MTLSQLDEYIKIYENYIPNELCDNIINTYENTKLWYQQGAGTDGKINQNVRMVDGINIKI